MNQTFGKSHKFSFFVFNLTKNYGRLWWKLERFYTSVSARIDLFELTNPSIDFISISDIGHDWPKLLLYQTNPNWITHQQVNRQILRHIAQHELSAVWRFNGSNGSHRSLCWMQNPRQEQSDRSSSGWRWQRFMDRVMGKSQRELPVRNTITLLWPHFRKILSSF